MSNNSFTPKLLIALPKNTGAKYPSKYNSLLKGSYTPSTNSASSRSLLAAFSPIILSSSIDSKDSYTYSCKYKYFYIIGIAAAIVLPDPVLL